MRALIGMAVIATTLGAGARAASAQIVPWNGRARISINVGGQLSTSTFNTTTTRPVNAETATINTAYTVPKGELFEGGFVYRLAGSFGVGVALSSFSERHDAAVSGSIPNPFDFNTQAYPTRVLSGTAAGVQHTEFATHIQAAYVIASRRFDVAIFGGPTIFHLDQDLVSDAAYLDTYPHDTVTFSSAIIAKASGTKVGFNVGADVGVKLTRGIGVGGLVRFSRATFSFPLTGSASDVSVDAGGPQVAGGIRFYF